MRGALKSGTEPNIPVITGPARFSEYHVEPERFGRLVSKPFPWLQSGASLLRSARAVLRQWNLDFEEMAPRMGHGFVYRSPVAVPAIMLAAMGCENGLKAVIVAKTWPHGGTTPLPAKLPDNLTTHDLTVLVARAKIAVVGLAEDAAIKEGCNFIEYAGRYPTMKSAEQTHAWYHHQAPILLAAYTEIFLRCGEETAKISATTPAAVSDFGLSGPAEEAAKVRAALEETLAGIPKP